MKIAVLALTILFNLQLFAQEQIGIQHTRKKITTDFSPDMLYYKKSGKKVSYEEFEKIIKQYSNLPFEPVFDNNGEIVRWLYDPENPFNSYRSNTENLFEIGDYYPELVFKTIEGETIRIEDLRGKMIILRYELDADTFRFKKREITEIDQGINATKRKSEIEAVIVFDADDEQIKRGFDLLNSNFKLVPNGFNFFQKMKVNRTPYTVIIDKQGRLLEYFQMSEGIDIMDLLNRS